MKGEKGAWGDWLRRTFMKPADPDAPVAANAGEPQTVEELEAAIKSANDKERLVGLLAAPFAAAIALLVTGAQIAHDPPALVHGHVNKLHTNPSFYLELAGVLVVMAVLMIVLAMLRKRLYLGIVLALFGLAVFNLHYWGFGIPYLLFGSWLLVRAYRLQRSLREAGGGSTPSRASPTASRPSAGANKRYTPSTSTTKRPSKPKNQPAG